MGAWDELDTEIIVDVDTKELDEALSLINKYNEAIFEPAKEIVENIKEAIVTGSEKASYGLADETKSLQEQTLMRNENYESFDLVRSIKIEKKSSTDYIVGTNITHFYPLCIEKGRGPVRPIRFKYLHYFMNGVEIFSKYSRPSKAYPFVKPTAGHIQEIAVESVVSEITNLLK